VYTTVVQTLLERLEAHLPADDREAADLARMKRAAALPVPPTTRKDFPEHFTASAVVVSADGQRVCLLLHAKLHRWLQPGGHCEPGDGDISASALREAREETGLQVQLVGGLLDVDAHVIPARKDEPEHTHLDLRFLVRQVGGELAHDPNESHGAKWLEWDEALRVADEAPLRRMLSKARSKPSPDRRGPTDA
jgi:8-oxo-dGTP pyrophosphatase MutT (NUDIX family)